ncbi:hypothetical protein SAMN05216391_1505 [Lachnospiraceae bacterium KHCPX20]|nr:hypothetical protein SAMN05216391_1505 [Lachnospiraceae bacterium KHCPX20]
MKIMKKKRIALAMICLLAVFLCSIPYEVQAAKKMAPKKKSVKVVSELTTEDGFKENFSYNKKGLLKKAVVDFAPEDGIAGDVVINFTYNRNYLMTKAVVLVSGEVVDTYTYSYNAKGKLTTVRKDDSDLTMDSSNDKTCNNTCSYKKIKVDKSYIKKIKAQQSHLIHENGVENKMTLIGLGWG